MAHTSSNGFSTLISPLMRRELEDVRSICTPTSSHASPVSVVWDSDPPKNHTFRAVFEAVVVDVGAVGGIDAKSGVGTKALELGRRRDRRARLKTGVVIGWSCLLCRCNDGVGARCTGVFRDGIVSL